MAQNNNAAIQKLCEMFPHIDRNTIENVLQNDAKGDGSQAIIILSRTKGTNNNINVVDGPTQSGVNINQIVVQQPPVQQTRVIVVQQPMQIQTVVPRDQNTVIVKQKITCWSITLYVMWGILLAGYLAVTLMGLIFLFVPAIIPGLIEIICISLIIYGISKANYGLSIFGCIWAGLNTLGLFMGIIVFWYWGGWVMFMPPFIYYACVFSFSIVLTKEISKIQN